jgi:hypothetical protein
MINFSLAHPTVLFELGKVEGLGANLCGTWASTKPKLTELVTFPAEIQKLADCHVHGGISRNHHKSDIQNLIFEPAPGHPRV